MGRNGKKALAVVPPPTPPAAEVWEEGPPLTEKQHRFLERYLIDRNATRAYMDVYGVPYESALTAGPRLLGNVRIAKALQIARQERAERSASDADKVIRELERIASSDLTDIWETLPAATEGGDPGPMRLKPIRDWPLEARRAIAGMKIKRYPERRTSEGMLIEEAHEVMEIKFWNKNEALKLLGLHHGAKFNRAPLDEAGNAMPSVSQTFIIAGQAVVFQ
jgi:phage terminase small subunit